VAARGRQPDSREGQDGLCGVADRPVVPSKPGNSGGRKGPDFGSGLEGGENRESDHVVYNLQQTIRNHRKDLATAVKERYRAVLCAASRIPSESRMREIRLSGSARHNASIVTNQIAPVFCC
jgi:hypothetical protein